MNALLGMGLMTLLASTTYGQQNTNNADEKAVLAATKAILTSWNNHNYADIATYTTADVDWVNVVGMWWKGRDAVQKAHQVYHEKMFKNTSLTSVNSTVRFITPDVAIVHDITHVSAYVSPDGHPLGNDQNIATLVFVKQQGRWLLTAGQNVPISANAAKHDPVNAAR